MPTNWLGALSIGPSRSSCRIHHLLILYHPLLLPRYATRVSNSKSIFTVIIQCKAMANCLDTLSTSASGGTLGNSQSSLNPEVIVDCLLGCEDVPGFFRDGENEGFYLTGRYPQAGDMPLYTAKEILRECARRFTDALSQSCIQGCAED